MIFLFKADHDSAAFDKLRPRARRGELFGPEFLDPARNPEFIEGLTAEGLVAGCTLSKNDCRKTPLFWPVR